MCSRVRLYISVPLGAIVYVGQSVCYRGVKSEAAEIVENEIGTDDLLILVDGRTCWASELDAN